MCLYKGHDSILCSLISTHAFSAINHLLPCVDWCSLEWMLRLVCISLNAGWGTQVEQHFLQAQVCVASQTAAAAVDKASPLLVEMHAAHSRRVSVQGVDTLASLSIPDFQRSVCRSTDDDVVPHLWWPDSACVPNQCPQTLERNVLLSYPFDRVKWNLRKSNLGGKSSLS